MPGMMNPRVLRQVFELGTDEITDSDQMGIDTVAFGSYLVRLNTAFDDTSVVQLSRNSGVSELTLYDWRNHSHYEGRMVPADPSNPESWNGENK